ncbi:hypothetical protein IWW38_005691, partial [Coemansia aciculifera]
FLPEHLAPKPTEDDDNPVDADIPAAIVPPVAPPPLSADAAAQPGSMAATNIAQRQNYQQQQQQLQQVAPAQNTPSYTEETISAVMALGVSRDEAIRHLDAADGNPDVAASLIFS